MTQNIENLDSTKTDSISGASDIETKQPLKEVRGHLLYPREDGLAHCSVCGGAEASLPTECPKKRMTEDEEGLVQSGGMDYKDNTWQILDSFKYNEVVRRNAKKLQSLTSSVEVNSGIPSAFGPLTVDEMQREVEARKPPLAIVADVKVSARIESDPPPSLAPLTDLPPELEEAINKQMQEFNSKQSQFVTLPKATAIPDNHWRHPDTGRIYPSVILAREAVKTLLKFIGEFPDRDGLKDTPSRVVKALYEMTSGYRESSPAEILSRTFKQPYDEIVVVRNIPFSSLCEHHLLVMSGTVDIGYLPNQSIGVVGLSKLPRLVDHFSKRLQIQERLTQQIAAAIVDHLQVQGVGVIVRASHNCLSCRGATKHAVEMVTSSMLGVFRTKSEARAELLSLFKG